VVVLALLLWLVILQVSPTSAEFLGLNLNSNLKANYGADDRGGFIGALRLSVVQDFMGDAGVPDDLADQHAKDLVDELDEPVPTATALNFAGDAPFTATPTFTFTPTRTLTNTPTPTPTRTPTRTPIPTRTPTLTSPPTSTAAPATATHTSTPAGSTSTATLTPTATLSQTVTSTSLPTPPSVYASSVEFSTGVSNPGDAIGGPDGSYANVGTSAGAELAVDLEGFVTVTGTTRLAIYERQVSGPSGIQMDQVVVSVGTDVNFDLIPEWTVVYIFGDDVGETTNFFIPSASLYDNYAFIVNLGGTVTSPIRWVRFQNYPVGVARPSGEQVQVDSVKVLP
jgi:hypothetical protein